MEEWIRMLKGTNERREKSATWRISLWQPQLHTFPPFLPPQSHPTITMVTFPSATFSAAMVPRKAVATAASLPKFKKAALFGLKSAGRGRGGATCMASYKVKLITLAGESVFECPDDVYIVDRAEDEGLEVPYSCRAGKVVSGSVDQSDGSFLNDDQVADGWVLTCVAYPTSDVVIETHKEADLTF